MKRLLLRLLHGKPERTSPKPERLPKARTWAERDMRTLEMHERLKTAREAFTLNADDLTLPEWADDPRSLLQ